MTQEEHSTGALEVPSGVIEDTTLVGAFSLPEVRKRAREDMNFLAALALPEVCEVDFPDLFLSMWGLCTSALSAARDFSKFALGLPRGHGKTTVLKILILYTILFTRKKFILIVCASQSLAENILSDVGDILDSPNILAVFGNWRTGQETDRTNLKKFNYQGRNIILAAMGSGSSLRGLNIKNSRPDVILCDDMQSKEEAESEITAKKLLSWFVGTLMKAKNPRNCTFLYIGNMYRDIRIGGSQSQIFTCILRNLQKNPSWISWIVGGVLADGSALWEEVQPLDQLIEELKSDISMGCADVWWAEVQNDPECGGGGSFDLSKLPGFDLDPLLDSPTGKFLMIDPSLGKKKSDAQVVGEFWVYDGLPYLWKIHIKQVTSPALVEWCLDYAVVEKIPLIVAEAVAYQGTLLQWFEHFAVKRELEGIVFHGINPGGRSKNSRILDYLKSLMAGKTAVHPTCLAAVLSQISTFDPIRLNNTDDILDVGAYSEDIMLQHAGDMILPDIWNLEPEDWKESGVMEASENCVF